MNLIARKPSARIHRQRQRAAQSGITIKYIARRVGIRMSSEGHRQEAIESIHVQLGRLSAGMERAREDRTELKDVLNRLNNGQDALRQQVSALTQTVGSTATAMAGLVAEKHGQRIEALEENMKALHGLPGRVEWTEGRVKSWDRWIGSGRAFVGKIVVALFGSTAFVVGILHWLGVLK
jgi:chromosome segregation ATPase